MTPNKKKSMSREDAAELYRDLQKAMAKTKGGKVRAAGTGASAIDAKAIAESIKSAMRRDEQQGVGERPSSAVSSERAVPMRITKGQYSAVCFVLLFAGFKVVLSAMESTGFASVAPAEAAIAPAPRVQVNAAAGFSKEDLKILTALDARRAELEQRSSKLDDRQADLDRRDREFATRMTQLRELTERLASERDKNEKKRNGQLDQLANVYGSMNPPEAAALIEQLDVQIALSLLERMPEKRIGQILALMSPERALAITKMLSGRSH